MGRVLSLPLCCALLLQAASAPAVVHTTGDGAGNTTPPTDDPGFANVGSTPTGLSGVYLGHGWVLTAAHVGEQTFRFLGVEYPALTGSRRIIQKDGWMADLALVKLAGPPPELPPLALASAPIAPGDRVTLVGNGWSRESQARCWSSEWSEVACPGGTRKGYRRSGGRIVRWGVNAVSLAGVEVPLGTKRTRAFGVMFDEQALADEAQIVNGDSGGAAFLQRGGQWELAGIHFALAPFAGQPGDVVAFGNTGYSADLYHYRGEIGAIAVAVPQVPAVPAHVLAWGALALLVVARRRLSPDRRAWPGWAGEGCRGFSPRLRASEDLRVRQVTSSGARRPNKGESGGSPGGNEEGG